MSTIQLRHMSRLRVERSGESEVLPLLTVDLVESGTGRLLSDPPIASGDGQNRFRPGDVLFNKLRPYLAKTVEVCEPMHGSGEFLCIVPGNLLDSTFLRFVTLSTAWLEHAAMHVYGTKMPRASWDQMSKFRILRIDLEEQRRIADFLDDQVSPIDNIISARRQQAEATRDRLRSTANEITFSAFAPDSGTRLKSLYDVIDDRAALRELPLLSVSIHLGVVPRSSITDDEARADDMSGYKVSSPGDIVLNRMRAFQGAIGINGQLGIVSPDYLVLRPKRMVRADWLHYVFRSDWFVGEMVARLRGIGSVELGSVRTPRINAADLGEIRLLLPELAEQGRAVGILVDAQRACEGVVNTLEQSIALLAEYKQSLITAAVTGELDVTTASTRIPA